MRIVIQRVNRASVTINNKLNSEIGKGLLILLGIEEADTDEDLKWLTATVLKNAGAWKADGWAYIADCTAMEPVAPDEVGELIEMTKAFVEAGCKAFGFAEGESIMLKAQTKANTKFSHTGVIEGHFATVQDVLDWLQKDIHI